MEGCSYIGDIRLEQKRQVEQIRYMFSHELSSHAFASLFLWKKHLGLTLYLADQFFVVKCNIRGENTWFFPCGNDDMKKMFISRHIKEDDFSLCYLEDRDKAFLERYYPGCFFVSEEESSSEYLYDREAYETIRGRKFSNMRKQINRLQKEHKIEIKALCDENINIAWKILHAGFSESDTAEIFMPKAADVIEEALQYRKELELFGILVFVDDTAQSMVMGFPLTEDTLDGCIEYSNTSLHGLSYLSKRAWFLFSGEQYRYMNAEEDLGLPGLRMAKRHMAPIRQNRIWQAAKI